MQPYRIPIWKTAPFSRLILPFITGIILQWYRQYNISIVLISVSCFSIAFFLFYLLPLKTRYRFQSLQGVLLFLIMLVFAMFITWQKDIRHHYDWFGHQYNDSRLIVKINEPIIEKVKSFKAEGCVESILEKNSLIRTSGKVFIYFSKDSSVGALQYGDKILIDKPLQRIKNSGNPGAFNYERYAAFQQAFHTVYLKQGDWILLPEKSINLLNRFIFSLRTHIVTVLQKYIYGNKDVLGIAEALLIGYKEDLDKDLVQAYSNAGVVHIIAISGLHLGLIYVMLTWIFNHLPLIKNQKLVKIVLILGCLWIFSLLTGASASVLRSAVMFTCIVIGKQFFRQANIYNSLAASAFILLCYDPYFLWDVGFQLSYFAVIGIVALQKPVTNILYFKSKMMNKVWGMLAITFAAQLITFPICIYYFHQFPNLFFITNFIAVPLSTIILFVEIFLIAFSWIPSIAVYAGKLTGGLVWLMNFIIKFCNSLPFSLLDNIYADVFTTWLLYCFILFACAWLLNRNKRYYSFAFASLVCFTCLQVYVKLKVKEQKKIIIYNVTQHPAIDFIYQDQYQLYGDSSMQADGLLKNFHLKPARIFLGANISKKDLTGLFHQNNEWQFYGKKIIMVDSTVHISPLEKKLKFDILILSKNPSLKIADLVTAVKPSIIVFDASNSLWKIAVWKKECLALALSCFSIPEQGAFIVDIK